MEKVIFDTIFLEYSTFSHLAISELAISETIYERKEKKIASMWHLASMPLWRSNLFFGDDEKSFRVHFICLNMEKE